MGHSYAAPGAPYPILVSPITPERGGECMLYPLFFCLLPPHKQIGCIFWYIWGLQSSLQPLPTHLQRRGNSCPVLAPAHSLLCIWTGNASSLHRSKEMSYFLTPLQGSIRYLTAESHLCTKLKRVADYWTCPKSAVAVALLFISTSTWPWAEIIKTLLVATAT